MRTKPENIFAPALIGLIYQNKGDLDNALKYLSEAKAIFEKIGAKPQLDWVNQQIEELKSQSK
jgi:tetratricopeptide (TPR) repeat protein